MLKKTTIADLLLELSDEVDPWPPPLEIPDPANPCTDAANAKRFAESFGRSLIYVQGIGWHVWQCSYWKHSPHMADRYAQKLGRLITREAIEKSEKSLDETLSEGERSRLRDEGEMLLKWAKTSESSPRMKAAVEHAKTHLMIQAMDIDADPMLFGCQNGVVDLQTGKLLPPRRCYLITQVASVSYDEGAECPLWVETLGEIFNECPELISYLQRYFGYALTGSVQEHQMAIFWGTGRNGKSTVVSTIRTVMGGYARQAPPDLFITTSYSRHNELADLHCARLVTAAESPESGKLNESLVKSITGGDPIKGRRLYKDFIEFTPTHKMLLMTNHKPIITGTDEGIWRRVHLIPFISVIRPDDCDPMREDRLRKELPGILNWCVKGCIQWQKEGLNVPKAVLDATREYRRDQDVLGDFIDECAELKGSVQVTAKAFYNRYQDWCEESGVRPESQKWLWPRLEERGIQKTRTSNGVVYRGIGLRRKAGKNWHEACAG